MLVGFIGLSLKSWACCVSNTPGGTKSTTPNESTVEKALTPVSATPLPTAPLVANVKDDTLLMQKIRESVKKDPALAVSLAYEARRSFPASPRAEERDALLIDGLINLQKIGAARDEAERYLERYPNGRYASYIFAMTGASPRPKGPR